MSKHELKCWPAYFQPLVEERKAFEVRENDRGFVEGDELCLREWDEAAGEYTGRVALCGVDYVLHGGRFGIKEGFVVMSIWCLKLSVGASASSDD